MANRAYVGKGKTVGHDKVAQAEEAERETEDQEANNGALGTVPDEPTGAGKWGTTG